jgi:hypothetical protein
MPIWLRKFTFNKLKEHYDKINNNESSDNVSKSIEAMKSAGSVNKTPIPKTITPNTYITKASKK